MRNLSFYFSNAKKKAKDPLGIKLVEFYLKVSDNSAMRKIIISFIVVVIFVVLLFVLGSQTGKAPTNSPAISPSPTPNAQKAPNTFLVQITSQGLSVSELNIKVGDMVTFKNVDSARHWPAAGPHPTHQICSGFDALKGLSQNESYSYKFTEAKTCPFHDHLNITDRYFGKITVSE
ncbi:MAG: hypothetical protein HYX21_01000 [Candidatus Yanofskybacteria bacterium]|nr:hypothetical protein [Candidatus Yanofskybacteria bacterium]